MIINKSIQMDHRPFIVQLMIILTAATQIRCQDFGYEGPKGPSHWGEQFNTCFGKYQSPIDIDSLNVKHINLKPLIFDGLDLLPNQTIIKNNGHTVMVSIESDHRPTIRGGPLTGPYAFSQFHFHWGENDTFGSEDLIDGQSFPMELHMVFYKKQYRNIRSAMENSDGLAVLAFFFHLDDEDNQNYVEITELLANVSEPETSASFQRMKSIGSLLLPELDQYYTYHGSLTTPPCSEVVTWIDFKQSIPLSHAQIELFRTIHDEDGHSLTHNFRPTQPVGDRAVYFVESRKSMNDDDFGADTRLDEPSQDLDIEHKHDRLTQDAPSVKEHPINNNAEQTNAMAAEQESNRNTLDGVELTTTRHRKFPKLGKNNANQSFYPISVFYLLLVGLSVIFAMKQTIDT